MMRIIGEMSMKKEVRENIKVLIWIYLLNFIAGYLNFSMLFLFATTVTNFTGSLTHIPYELVEGDYAQVIFYLVIIGLFCLGVTIDGIIFHHKKFEYSPHYGYILIVLSVVSFLSILLFDYATVMPIFSFVAGLQNGMYINYKGMVIRMTHLSGYLTDLSFSIGRLLRGNHEDNFKIYLCSTSIFCFMLGAFTLSILIMKYHTFLLLLIPGMYLIASLYYFIILYGGKQ